MWTSYLSCYIFVVLVINLKLVYFALFQVKITPKKGKYGNLTFSQKFGTQLLFSVYSLSVSVIKTPL